MKVIDSPQQMQVISDEIRRSGKRIGFVPTMGFLHEGHLNLFRLASENSDQLVVSIFVNPIQFDPKEDFKSYPRDPERDEDLCRDENVDYIFYPTTSALYPSGFQTFVQTETLSEQLCGISRPIHFRGVTTIVCKLFNIVQPHVAVFGQKDAQQALIIRKMVDDLHFRIKILTGAIVREIDGLAMSSRNKYLSATERKQATIIFKSLITARDLIEKGQLNAQHIIKQMYNVLETAPLLKSEYLEIVDYNDLNPVRDINDQTLIALAARIGRTRLIDNLLIHTLDPLHIT